MSSVRDTARSSVVLRPAGSTEVLGPPGRGLLRVGFLATLIGLLAFLGVQVVLTLYNVDVERDAAAGGLLVTSPDRLMIAYRLYPALVGGAIAYLILGFVGSAIATGGHRILFALPAIGFVFASLLAGSEPEPIGSGWAVECYTMNAVTCDGPWFAHPWFGPTIDLFLVLAPAWILTRHVDRRRWPARSDAASIAAILTSVAVVITVGWAIAVIESHVDLRTIAAIGALGIVLGVSRPWWPWLHALFAAFAVGMFGLLIDSIFWPDPNFTALDALPYTLQNWWPIVAVGLIASAWQPLAWAIRRGQERPMRLVIAVNVLNIVDALLTFVAVRSGGAFESNPVVRLVGLPAKVVLVGLLTWLLYGRKPSALIWPAAALLVVACYHVVGILVNGWR